MRVVILFLLKIRITKFLNTHVKLETVSIAFLETLEVGLQITCMVLIFIYYVVWGQKCSLLDTRKIRDCDWNREKFTVFIIRHDLESDHRVLGEDNLTVVKILEGEHIVSRVGFDSSGHIYLKIHILVFNLSV
jgi:hypothetical protein